MSDQAFDSAFQSDGGGGAAGTGAVHREIEVAVLVPFVDDVTPVLRDRGPHARFDQLLDLVDDIRIGRVFVEVGIRSDMDSSRGTRREKRSATDELVEQRLKYQRFEVGPGCAGRRGDRNEIASVEDTFDHAAVEQGPRERRAVSALRIGKVARASLNDGLARKELAGRGVRGLLGADQHGSDVGRGRSAIKWGASPRDACPCDTSDGTWCRFAPDRGGAG